MLYPSPRQARAACLVTWASGLDQSLPRAYCAHVVATPTILHQATAKSVKKEAQHRRTAELQCAKLVPQAKSTTRHPSARHAQKPHLFALHARLRAFPVPMVGLRQVMPPWFAAHAFQVATRMHSVSFVDLQLNFIPCLSRLSCLSSTCLPYNQYTQGMTNCTACEEGKYSTLRAFQGPCTEDCSSGRYSDVEALSSVEQCKQCPSNTFSTVSGASDISTCMACTPPATSPPGSSSCSSCSAGTYSPAGGACLTCAKGHICVSGGIVKCAAGTFNDNEGSSLASDCKPCPAGTYSSYEGLTCGLGRTTDCSLQLLACAQN